MESQATMRIGCFICEKSFKTRKTALTHQRNVHKDVVTEGKPHKCRLCGKPWATEQLCSEHEERHSAGRPFKCSYCDKHFGFLRSKKNHEINFHTFEKKFDCTVEGCGKKYASAGALKNHMHVSHNFSADGEEAMCEHCGKRFPNKLLLYNHKSSTHNRKIRIFQCTCCDKTFKNRQALREHELAQKGFYFFPCRHCPKRFVSSTRRKVHERMHSTDRPHQCKHCGAGFHQKYQCKNHESRVHERKTKVKPNKVQCTVCSRSFAHQYVLSFHMKCHDKRDKGDKEFQCDMCEKWFSTQKGLNVHFKLTHTNLRKYECKICHKLFKTVGHLQFHTNSHIAKKSFRCTICGKQLASNLTYRNHMVTFHKDISAEAMPTHNWKCTLCEMRFENERNLNQHLDMKHKTTLAGNKSHIQGTSKNTNKKFVKKSVKQQNAVQNAHKERTKSSIQTTNKAHGNLNSRVQNNSTAPPLDQAARTQIMDSTRKGRNSHEPSNSLTLTMQEDIDYVQQFENYFDDDDLESVVNCRVVEAVLPSNLQNQGHISNQTRAIKGQVPSGQGQSHNSRSLQSHSQQRQYSGANQTVTNNIAMNKNSNTQIVKTEASGPSTGSVVTFEAVQIDVSSGIRFTLYVPSSGNAVGVYASNDQGPMEIFHVPQAP